MYEFDPSWLAKLDALRAAGVHPYPNGMAPTHTSTELHARFAAVADPSAEPEARGVAVAGRVMFRNIMGKAVFLRVQDRGEPTVEVPGADGEVQRKGGVIQVYVRREDVGPEAFDLVKGLDIGDHVWASGVMMRTRSGELTLQASACRLAGKILSPFPDRWHTLSDPELRSRQRYVDLFLNEETRATFRMRSRVLRYVRDFFERREFLEVETPMMHVIPGGAAARPFTTHHNALDIDLYLRVAPELYLKRLLVGGLERVFEINRNFRNEGVSVKHNPEFTMLEFYQAWATMDDLVALTEELLSGLVRDLLGGTDVVWGERTLSFATPFRRADMDELIAEQTAPLGLPREALRDVDAMTSFWRARHPDRSGDGDDLPTTVGRWWERLFETFVEATLLNPTFVTGFPAEISPLSRRRDDDPERVDRFELIVNGWEIANAFSELNDPVDQAGRFAAQVAAREAGDHEAMYFDHDYVRALSYGMPPAAGEGLGIDRLVMLLTNRASIREVILFPTLRPERPADAQPS
ncbi:MAG TPA: lysine--tRNA ligase [Myxococcota bacterium]|nr:lysine--tRNA ligase [Myxococcota bacterium]